jgi:hypothetical protein
VRIPHNGRLALVRQPDGLNIGDDTPATTTTTTAAAFAAVIDKLPCRLGNARRHRRDELARVMFVPSVYVVFFTPQKLEKT